MRNGKVSLTYYADSYFLSLIRSTKKETYNFFSKLLLEDKETGCPQFKLVTSMNPYCNSFLTVSFFINVFVFLM